MATDYISDSERNAKLLFMLYRLDVKLTDEQFADLHYYINYRTLYSIFKRPYCP